VSLVLVGMGIFGQKTRYTAVMGCIDDGLSPFTCSLSSKSYKADHKRPLSACRGCPGVATPGHGPRCHTHLKLWEPSACTVPGPGSPPPGGSEDSTLALAASKPGGGSTATATGWASESMARRSCSLYISWLTWHLAPAAREARAITSCVHMLGTVRTARILAGCLQR